MDKIKSNNMNDESLSKFIELAKNLKEKDILKFNRMLGRLEGMVENEKNK